MPINLNVELQIVVFAVINNQLTFLLRKEKETKSVQINKLLSGPFIPEKFITLTENIKAHLQNQADVKLEYIEQLYSFGDAYRKFSSLHNHNHNHNLSIAYLGLCQDINSPLKAQSFWDNIYHYFPYENWQDGIPKVINQFILPKLFDWANDCKDITTQKLRHNRIIQLFGGGQIGWQEELCLERFELLFEAGLVKENAPNNLMCKYTGEELFADHRRILATALARLRGKLRYRPIIFTFLPKLFTLQFMQQTIETIIGFKLHKQNFRRSVACYVKESKKIFTQGKGRPAKLFSSNSQQIQDEALHHISLPRCSHRVIF